MFSKNLLVYAKQILAPEKTNDMPFRCRNSMPYILTRLFKTMVLNLT